MYVKRGLILIQVVPYHIQSVRKIWKQLNNLKKNIRMKNGKIVLDIFKKLFSDAKDHLPLLYSVNQRGSSIENLIKNPYFY